MPWDFALILFALGVVVPWRGAVRMRKLLARPSLETADRLMLYVSTIVFQWLAVAVVAWRCYARGFTAQRLVAAFPPLVLSLLVNLGLFVTTAEGLRPAGLVRATSGRNIERTVSGLYATHCRKS